MPPLAILDRSAVAMATGSPRLVFGAASGITAEDLMFSTHLGSANMARHSSALSIPCLGHSGWHPSDWRPNLSLSARLTDGPCHYGKRLSCHMQSPINRCKQSALVLRAEAPLPRSNMLQLFDEPVSSSPSLCLKVSLLINIQYVEDPSGLNER